MSVVDGLSVNASVTNAAFVSRTSDTNTVGVLALENTLNVDSGALVTNAQRAINETFDAVGMTGEGDTARNDYSSNNIVTNGDDRKVAVGKLDAEFDAATGHAHTGAAGEGAPISASDLTNINYYRASWQSFDTTGVTGSTKTVTTELTGKTPGGGVSVVGVVTSAPNNKVIIYDTDTGQSFEDAEGQKVYGRLTHDGTDFVVTFYTLEVGVETAYNFAGSVDPTIYYVEVFTLATVPTIPATPEFGSLDITADVADATAAVRGLVSVGTQTFGGEKTFNSIIIDARLAVGKTIDNVTTGANALVDTFIYPLHVLTNGSLTSIGGLVEDGRNKQCVLINRTGNDVALIHEDATIVSPANRIHIAGSANITFKNNQAMYFIYENDQDRWYTTSVDAASFNTSPAFGSTPNAKGVTYSSGTGNFNLEPANGSNPGAVSTALQTLGGQKVFQDGVKLNTRIELNSATISTSGSNAVLTIAQPQSYLTNASLVSVGGINPIENAASADIEAVFILVNKTGVTVLVNNEDTVVTAVNRILTGTGAAITLLNDASLWLTYDLTATRWRVVGGSGSGNGGGINFVTNGDAEGANDFFTFADAAASKPVDGTGGSPNIIAASLSGTSPLAGLKSFLLAKDSAANRQGEGWSIPFTIDDAYRGKVLGVSFDYLVSAGSMVAGTATTDSDVTIYLYDVTNSLLIEPQNRKLFSNSSTLSQNFYSYFQASPNSGSYRLIFFLGTTAATALTLKVDNISVSPMAGVSAKSGQTLARYKTASSQSIPDATQTIIDYGTKDFDLSANVTTGASWKFTAQESGYYLVAGRVQYVSSSWGANTQVRLDLFKNGSLFTYLGYFRTEAASGADLPHANGTTTIYLAAGDYIDFRAYQDNGGAKLLSGDSNGNWVTIQKISDDTQNTALSTLPILYSAYGTPTNAISASPVTVEIPTQQDNTSSVSAGVLTALVSGTYEYSCTIGVGQSAAVTAGNVASLFAVKNGSTVGKDLNVFPVVGAAGYQLKNNLSGSVYLSAGDTFKFEYSNQQTTNVSFNSNATLTVKRLVDPSTSKLNNLAAVKYYNNAGTSISTTPQALVFPTKDIDTTGSFASGVFTALETGYHNVSFTLTSQTTLATTAAWYAEIIKTGSIVQFANVKAGTGASNDSNSVSGSGLVYLAAGEQLWLNTYLDAAGPISLFSTGYNQISIHKVG